jgi:hypothetical protein
MACPATQILRLLGSVLLSAAAAIAQEPPSKPLKSAAENAPARERIVSEHVAELLAASRPHFEVIKAEEKKAPEPSVGSPEKPLNEIVRLPNYVVKEAREPRVPSPEDVRTPRGLEVYAMKKYLGSTDSFSRGVLNHFTLADAWKKAVKNVPLLNQFEWATSPEKRALDMYYDDEVRKKLRGLYDELAPPSKPAPAGGK